MDPRVDDLIDCLAKFDNQTLLIVEWEDGGKIKGRIDTMYGTDNGLEDDENAYKEYFAVALEIKEIIKEGIQVEGAEIGSLVEISIIGTDPYRVSLEHGTVLWQKQH